MSFLWFACKYTDYFNSAHFGKKNFLLNAAGWSLAKRVQVVRLQARSRQFRKYLRSLGIDSQQKYNASGFNINDHIRTQESFGTRQYRKSYLTNCLGQKYSIKQIVELFPAATAMAYIPFCTINADDLPIIEQFLKDKFKECWHPNYKYRTYYRKLACLYDFLKNGWS